ncbi:hypothetical protein CL616_03775 [archaeon]|nr:hypothetical protein [archaeon]
MKCKCCGQEMPKKESKCTCGSGKKYKDCCLKKCTC